MADINDDSTIVASGDDPVGKRAGRFQILSLIGKGGMGEVYLAEDMLLKRTVALKRISARLRSDSQYRDLLVKEAERASKLNNERVAQIYDVLEDKGGLFIVMEYIEGTTLRPRLNEPLTVPEFLNIAIECTEALQAAHQAGITHGDIKPENIMITRTGRVKICDFGLAADVLRPDASGVTSAPISFRGTPAYMAPEALLKQHPDARADIFSLGIVFYEMLTGKHPFRVEDNLVATVDAILRQTPPSVSTLNPAAEPLSTLVQKALAKDAANRYETASELLADLRKLKAIGERSGAARSDTRKALQLTASLIALIVVVAGLWILFSKVRTTPVSNGVKILAVLPFHFTGTESGNQAYTDGLIETVTAKLGRIAGERNFQVIPSSEVHARHVTTASEARSEFGSSLVLQGGVQQSGDAVRINYTLIDTASARQVGSDSITLPGSNPFDAQDRVFISVALNLGLQPQVDQRSLMLRYGTSTAGAYDFYLQGRGYLQNYDKPENLDNAISVFNQALKIDPNYALAFAGIGEAYWKKYEATKDSQWVKLSRENCEQALQLDPTASGPHICLGTVEGGTGQYEEAANDFEKALATEPTDDATYIGLATVYERWGKSEKAEDAYKRAIELRPQYWGGYSRLGGYYASKTRYADAERMFAQVVALAPDSYRGYSNLGGVYLLEQKNKEAIAAFERSLALRANYSAASNLGTLYFYEGDYPRAINAFKQALNIQATDYVVWGNLGAGQKQLKDEQYRQTYRRAIELAEAKLKLNPRDTAVMLDLARYHGSLNQKAVAVQLLAQVVQSRPNDPKLLFGAASIYESSLDDRNQALNYLQRALTLGLSLKDVERSVALKNLRADPRFQEMERAATNK